MVRAEVLLMSGGKVTENGFLYDEPTPGYPEAMRPLSTAQAIHTSLITCPLKQVGPSQSSRFLVFTALNEACEAGVFRTMELHSGFCLGGAGRADV